MQAIRQRYNKWTARFAMYVKGPCINLKPVYCVSMTLYLQLLINFKELLAITDTYVESTLRNQDGTQGKWLVEDPSLSQIQQALMRR